MKKKLSILVAIIMLFSVIPGTAFAAKPKPDLNISGFGGGHEFKAGESFFFFIDVQGVNYKNPRIIVKTAKGGLFIDEPTKVKNGTGIHRAKIPNDIPASADDSLYFEYYDADNPMKSINAGYRVNTYEWDTLNGRRILWKNASHTKKATNEDLIVDDKWCYFDSNGYLQTGLFNHKTGSFTYTYYANSDGGAHYGWKKVNGKWYYLGYGFAFSWAAVKNMVYVSDTDGKTYAFNKSGAMMTNTSKKDDTGKMLKFGADGAMKAKYTSHWAYEKGWKSYRVFDGVNPNGYGISGWKKIDGAWYHLSDGSTKDQGWYEIDGCMYYFDKAGKLVTNKTVDGLQIGANGVIVGEPGTGPKLAESPTKPVKHVVAVTSIKIPQKTIYLTPGKSVTVKTKALPTNAKNKKLTWKTSDKKKLINVSKKGKITVSKKAKAGRKATISITAANGKKVKITVNVLKKKKAVKSLKINKPPKTIKIGKSVTLKPVIKPKKATEAVYSWSSSNKSVATVDVGGTVKAIKKGKTTITLKAKNKRIKHTITVQ